MCHCIRLYWECTLYIEALVDVFVSCSSFSRLCACELMYWRQIIVILPLKRRIYTILLHLFFFLQSAYVHSAEQLILDGYYCYYYHFCCIWNPDSFIEIGFFFVSSLYFFHISLSLPLSLSQFPFAEPWLSFHGQPHFRNVATGTNPNGKLYGKFKWFQLREREEKKNTHCVFKGPRPHKYEEYRRLRFVGFVLMVVVCYWVVGFFFSAIWTRHIQQISVSSVITNKKHAHSPELKGTTKSTEMIFRLFACFRFTKPK